MFAFTARPSRQPTRLFSHLTSSHYGPGQVMFQRALRTLTTAAVLIVLGSLLVALNHWAGVGQGRVSWLGPMLCLVAVILVLLAFRYFVIARRHSQTPNTQISLQVIVENGRLNTSSTFTQRLNGDEPPDYTSVIMDTHLDPHSPPCYPDTPPPSYRLTTSQLQRKPEHQPPTYYEAVFNGATDTVV